MIGSLGLSCLHVPVLSYPIQRRLYCDAAINVSVAKQSLPHLIIGDLNSFPATPAELGNSLRDSQWLIEVAKSGWIEAWRHLHPADQEFTWFSRLYRGLPGNGFRLDQAWMSPALAPSLTSANYDHSAREDGLSDHSVLLLDFDNILSPGDDVLKRSSAT